MLKVWSMENDVDNFDYLGLKNVDDWEIINDFYEFNGKSIARTWNPIDVVVDVENKIGDSLYLFPGGPVFSERAVEVLWEFLEDKAEILPIKFTKGNYFIINTTNVLQAVDIERSNVIRFQSSGRIMMFESIEFIKEKVVNQSIFKIIELPKSLVFVSDLFKEKVMKNNLSGFKFTEVWKFEQD